MMASPGRPPGLAKTGGRKRGAIDREQRKVLTDQMAGDLMAVYRKLGGVKWLLKFAQDNPAEFLRQGLSRLLPAPQRGDDDTGGGTFNTQINFDANPKEAARRIAFALASAVHDDPSLAPVHISPEPVTSQRADWKPPAMPPLVQPEPVDDPERREWAASLPLTEEERADQRLIKETITGDLSSYRGGAGEQSSVRQPAAPTRKPTVNEIRRRQLL